MMTVFYSFNNQEINLIRDILYSWNLSLTANDDTIKDQQDQADQQYQTLLDRFLEQL